MLDRDKAFKVIQENLFLPRCYGVSHPFKVDGKDYMWFQATTGAIPSGIEGVLVDENYCAVPCLRTEEGYEGFPPGTVYKHGRD